MGKFDVQNKLIVDNQRVDVAKSGDYAGIPEFTNPVSVIGQEAGNLVIKMRHSGKVEFHEVGFDKLTLADSAEIVAEATISNGNRLRTDYQLFFKDKEPPVKVIYSVSENNKGQQGQLKMMHQDGDKDWEEYAEFGSSNVAQALRCLEIAFGDDSEVTPDIGKVNIGPAVECGEGFYFVGKNRDGFGWKASSVDIFSQDSTRVISADIGDLLVTVDDRDLGLKMGDTTVELPLKEEEKDNFRVSAGGKVYSISEDGEIVSDKEDAVDLKRQIELETLRSEVQKLHEIFSLSGLAKIGVDDFDDLEVCLGMDGKEAVSLVVNGSNRLGNILDQIDGTLRILEGKRLTVEERDLRSLKRRFGDDVARVDNSKIQVPWYLEGEKRELYLYEVGGINSRGLAFSEPTADRLLVVVFRDIVEEKTNLYQNDEVKNRVTLEKIAGDESAFVRGMKYSDKSEINLNGVVTTLINSEAEGVGKTVKSILVKRIHDHELFHGVDNGYDRDNCAYELAAEAAAFSDSDDPRVCFWHGFYEQFFDVFYDPQKTIDLNIDEEMAPNTKASNVGQVLMLDLFCQVMTGEKLLGNQDWGDNQKMHRRMMKIVSATPEEIEQAKLKLRELAVKYQNSESQDWLNELGYGNIKY